MYAYIKGKIAKLDATQAIIDVHGIGYVLQISLATYADIKNKSNEVELFAHLHIKEDAHTLWGFSKEYEKNMFLQLIAISGIGPNTARMMLSAIAVQDLKRAIQSENISLIQSIKGIGPKTAKRLVLELKDKVSKINEGGIELNMPDQGESRSNVDEALSALVALGFTRSVAEQTLWKIYKSDPLLDVEALIKKALQIL